MISTIMILIAVSVSLINVQAFQPSASFRVQRISPISSRFQPLSMTSTEKPEQIKVTEMTSTKPDQIKVTEIYTTPKVKEAVEEPNYDNESEEERYKRTKLAEIAEKQALEVFVSRNTGKWECQSCGYVYDEAKGNEKYAVAANTPFASIEKFRCPQCGANRKYFVAETETLSGFKENLNYGLGGNSMTGGQKGNLIFGGLFVGFLIFMSGYLLE